MVTFLNSFSSRRHSSWYNCKISSLHSYSPTNWLITSIESPKISTTSALISRSNWIPLRIAWYSAWLLVAEAIPELKICPPRGNQHPSNSRTVPTKDPSKNKVQGTRSTMLSFGSQCCTIKSATAWPLTALADSYRLKSISLFSHLKSAARACI